MKIIVINGVGGAGKDTFVGYCQNWQAKQLITNTQKYIQVYNISSVDYVKEIAKEIGWDGVKDQKGRRFLSDLKDAMTRYDDIPFKKIIEKINNHLNVFEKMERTTKNIVFFIHIREPKEIARFVKEYGAQSLLIQRPGMGLYDNHADENVGQFNYKYTIWNNKGLDLLKDTAENFMETIIKEGWFSDGEGIEIWDKDNYSYLTNIEWVHKLP